MGLIELQLYETFVGSEQGAASSPEILGGCWEFDNPALIGEDSLGDNHANVFGSGVGLTTGQTGQAVNFTQQNSYLQIPHSAGLSPTNSFTIEGRIKLNSGTTGGIIFSKHPLPFDANQAEYVLLTINNQRLVFLVAAGSVTFQNYVITASLSAQVWHDFKAIWDQDLGLIILDVDGIRTMKPASSGFALTPTAYPIRIGNTGENTRQLLGQIDFLKFHRNALP